MRSGKDVSPPVDDISYQSVWGGNGNGKTIALESEGSWKEAEPTPGAQNTFSTTEAEPTQQSQQENQQQAQPSVTFSAPSNVSAGEEFAVTVNLSNFAGGTYYVKVLVGKDGKFIYGNTRGASGWLTQSASWADFPTISGSGAVQAKIDDDVEAGSYLIKVRVHQNDKNYDSEERSISVSSASTAAVVPADTSDASGDEEEAESLSTAAGEEGRVLGEEASPTEKDSKLNFYLILGIFGILVGSGGLILAFRKRPLGSQR